MFFTNIFVSIPFVGNTAIFRVMIYIEVAMYIPSLQHIRAPAKVHFKLMCTHTASCIPALIWNVPQRMNVPLGLIANFAALVLMWTDVPVTTCTPFEDLCQDSSSCNSCLNWFCHQHYGAQLAIDMYFPKSFLYVHHVYVPWPQDVA